MARSFSRGLALALIATTAMSVAACSKKAPKYPTQTPTDRPTTGGQPPETRLPGGTTTPTTQGAIPGSIQDFVVNAGDRVYFDLDQYEIRDDATPVLDAQVAWLRRYPAVQVKIEGNADERGTREYNLALGARRANAVREYLVSHGVASNRVTTISFGKESPIDPGTGEDAYAKNRNAHTNITEGAR